MDFKFTDYVYILLALVFVLALVGIFATVARRFGLGFPVGGRGGGPRRISVSETLPLDAKHRLMIVRRDDQEHLILVGASADLVIERGFPARPGNFATALADAAAKTPPESGVSS